MIIAASKQHRIDLPNITMLAICVFLQTHLNRRSENSADNRGTYTEDRPSTAFWCATMRPAAACDWCPRQHRLIWVGAAYRLAVAALLPPLTYVASSLGYELDCLIHELDGQSYQAQKSIQPVHRQFTSLRERRRCRLAGLTPLTYLYYKCSCSIIQTYVRFLLIRIFLLEPKLITSCNSVPPAELPRESPRPTKAPLFEKTVPVMPSTNHNRKVA